MGDEDLKVINVEIKNIKDQLDKTIHENKKEHELLHSRISEERKELKAEHKKENKEMKENIMKEIKSLLSSLQLKYALIIISALLTVFGIAGAIFIDIITESVKAAVTGGN